MTAVDETLASYVINDGIDWSKRVKVVIDVFLGQRIAYFDFLDFTSLHVCHPNDE